MGAQFIMVHGHQTPLTVSGFNHLQRPGYELLLPDAVWAASTACISRRLCTMEHLRCARIGSG